MIKILTSEAYAFDYLSILEVKRNKNKTELNINNYQNCYDFIKKQLDTNMFNDIMISKEYNDLYSANLNTFNAVDLVKNDSILGSTVDSYNYARYLAKVALQERFFPEPLSEVKIGY